MKESQRLYFLDALRAFAILMMLQGHFVSGILDPLFKDTTNSFYNFWLYRRGFTAPVFFTVTGWVVLFLLLKTIVFCGTCPLRYSILRQYSPRILDDNRPKRCHEVYRCANE